MTAGLLLNFPSKSFKNIVYELALYPYASLGGLKDDGIVDVP